MVWVVFPPPHDPTSNGWTGKATGQNTERRIRCLARDLVVSPQLNAFINGDKIRRAKNFQHFRLCCFTCDDLGFHYTRG